MNTILLDVLELDYHHLHDSPTPSRMQELTQRTWNHPRGLTLAVQQKVVASSSDWDVKSTFNRVLLHLDMFDPQNTPNIHSPFGLNNRPTIQVSQSSSNISHIPTSPAPLMNFLASFSNMNADVPPSPAPFHGISTSSGPFNLSNSANLNQPSSRANGFLQQAVQSPLSNTFSSQQAQQVHPILSTHSFQLATILRIQASLHAFNVRVLGGQAFPSYPGIISYLTQMLQVLSSIVTCHQNSGNPCFHHAHPNNEALGSVLTSMLTSSKAIAGAPAIPPLPTGIPCVAWLSLVAPLARRTLLECSFLLSACNVLDALETLDTSRAIESLPRLENSLLALRMLLSLPPTLPLAFIAACSDDIDANSNQQPTASSGKIHEGDLSNIPLLGATGTKQNLLLIKQQQQQQQLGFTKCISMLSDPALNYKSLVALMNSQINSKSFLETSLFGDVACEVPPSREPVSFVRYRDLFVHLVTRLHVCTAISLKAVSRLGSVSLLAIPHSNSLSSNSHSVHSVQFLEAPLLVKSFSHAATAQDGNISNVNNNSSQVNEGSIVSYKTVNAAIYKNVPDKIFATLNQTLRSQHPFPDVIQTVILQTLFQQQQGSQFQGPSNIANAYLTNSNNTYSYNSSFFLDPVNQSNFVGSFKPSSLNELHSILLKHYNINNFNNNNIVSTSVNRASTAKTNNNANNDHLTLVSGSSELNLLRVLQSTSARLSAVLSFWSGSDKFFSTRTASAACNNNSSTNLTNQASTNIGINSHNKDAIQSNNNKMLTSLTPSSTQDPSFSNSFPSSHQLSTTAYSHNLTTPQNNTVSNSIIDECKGSLLDGLLSLSLHAEISIFSAPLSRLSLPEISIHSNNNNRNIPNGLSPANGLTQGLSAPSTGGTFVQNSNSTPFQNAHQKDMRLELTSAQGSAWKLILTTLPSLSTLVSSASSPQWQAIDALLTLATFDRHSTQVLVSPPSLDQNLIESEESLLPRESNVAKAAASLDTLASPLRRNKTSFSFKGKPPSSLIQFFTALSTPPFQRNSASAHSFVNHGDNRDSDDMIWLANSMAPLFRANVRNLGDLSLAVSMMYDKVSAERTSFPYHANSLTSSSSCGGSALQLADCSASNKSMSLNCNGNNNSIGIQIPQNELARLTSALGHQPLSTNTISSSSSSKHQNLGAIPNFDVSLEVDNELQQSSMNTKINASVPSSNTLLVLDTAHNNDSIASNSQKQSKSPRRFRRGITQTFRYQQQLQQQNQQHPISQQQQLVGSISFSSSPKNNGVSLNNSNSVWSHSNLNINSNNNNNAVVTQLQNSRNILSSSTTKNNNNNNSNSYTNGNTPVKASNINSQQSTPPTNNVSVSPPSNYSPLHHKRLLSSRIQQFPRNESPQDNISQRGLAGSLAVVNPQSRLQSRHLMHLRNVSFNAGGFHRHQNHIHQQQPHAHEPSPTSVAHKPSDNNTPPHLDITISSSHTNNNYNNTDNINNNNALNNNTHNPVVPPGPTFPTSHIRSNTPLANTHSISANPSQIHLCFNHKSIASASEAVHLPPLLRSAPYPLNVLKHGRQTIPSLRYPRGPINNPSAPLFRTHLNIPFVRNVPDVVSVSIFAPSALAIVVHARFVHKFSYQKMLEASNYCMKHHSSSSNSTTLSGFALQANALNACISSVISTANILLRLKASNSGQSTPSDSTTLSLNGSISLEHQLILDELLSAVCMTQLSIAIPLNLGFTRAPSYILASMPLKACQRNMISDFRAVCINNSTLNISSTHNSSGSPFMSSPVNLGSVAGSNPSFEAFQFDVSNTDAIQEYEHILNTLFNNTNINNVANNNAQKNGFLIANQKNISHISHQSSPTNAPSNTTPPPLSSPTNVNGSFFNYRNLYQITALSSPQSDSQSSMLSSYFEHFGSSEISSLILMFQRFFSITNSRICESTTDPLLNQSNNPVQLNHHVINSTPVGSAGTVGITASSSNMSIDRVASLNAQIRSLNGEGQELSLNNKNASEDPLITSANHEIGAFVQSDFTSPNMFMSSAADKFAPIESLHDFGNKENYNVNNQTIIGDSAGVSKRTVTDQNLAKDPNSLSKRKWWKVFSKKKTAPGLNSTLSTRSTKLAEDDRYVEDGTLSNNQHKSFINTLSNGILENTHNNISPVLDDDIKNNDNINGLSNKNSFILGNIADSSRTEKSKINVANAASESIIGLDKNSRTAPSLDDSLAFVFMAPYGAKLVAPLDSATEDVISRLKLIACDLGGVFVRDLFAKAAADPLP